MLQLSAFHDLTRKTRSRRVQSAAQEHNIHVHAEDTEVWQSHPTNDMHILRLGV